MESARNYYNKQYENWVPWLEEKYLGYFKTNKTSYVAQDKLESTKITGDKNVDGLQDKVNKTVTSQLDNDGLLGGVSNVTSKQVFDRSERQGKGSDGKYI